VSGEQPRPPPPGAEITADEEKRRSTGSISSLVRIWETDSSGGGAGAATSPSGAGGQLTEEGSRPGSVVKFEKRVWPPVKDRESSLSLPVFSLFYELSFSTLGLIFPTDFSFL
jgi:hypothetical protein